MPLRGVTIIIYSQRTQEYTNPALAQLFLFHEHPEKIYAKISLILAKPIFDLKSPSEHVLGQALASSY